MSVQSEIARLNTAKGDIAAAITNKGVSVPTGTKLDGMAALINGIETFSGTAEEWVLTLEDGSAVTKVVYVE